MRHEILMCQVPLSTRPRKGTCRLSTCASKRYNEHREAERRTDGDHRERPCVARVAQPGEVSSSNSHEPDACGGQHAKSRRHITMACLNWRGNRKDALPPIPVPTQEVHVAEQHRAGHDARAGERGANRHGDREDVDDDRQVQESAERCGVRNEQKAAGYPLSHADKPVIAVRGEEPREEVADRIGNGIMGQPFTTLLFTSPHGTKASASSTRTITVNARNIGCPTAQVCSRSISPMRRLDEISPADVQENARLYVEKHVLAGERERDGRP